MTDDDFDAEDPTNREEGEKGKRRSSKAWLAAIKEVETKFDGYQTKSDSIDKLYADLNALAATGRDRQFQLFWANIQVLGPAIYSHPPVPVIIPRFKERRPLPRTAAELLERATSVAFEKGDIDGVMVQLRDDLTILARGVAWVRYESKKENDGLIEKVCIEHVDRKDFVTELARKWEEVDWVAKRSYLTRKQMRKRFKDTSGDDYKDAVYAVLKDDKDNGAADKRLKAGVWEIWCKSENRVFWVAEGVEQCLDDDEPHLKLEGFFPCPKPVYSTVQRRSLIPVPDMVFYKDQLEEVNELTARISALSGAIKVRGFYPAGAGEIGDAIEAAIKSTSDNQVMVPVSNWAAFGNAGAKETIVWLPIDMIVTTIKELIQLRKELINDVYEITGLSDIMRGSTEASETATAQQLKSQYGSVRIKDRQAGLVRVARDLTRMAAEIMAENFSKDTLLEMSQMELPTDADITKQTKALVAQAEQIRTAAERQIAQAKQDPALMQQAQANPDQAKQMLAQIEQQVNQQLQELQGQAEKLKDTVTIDQVIDLLREQKTRPFTLDIETDSTIAADENAQKERAVEFMTSFGAVLDKALPTLQMAPQAAPLVAELLKYTASQFRAGRQLDMAIDEFTDQMKQLASQPKAPNPEHAKAQAEQQAAQIKQQSAAQTAQADAAEKMANAQKTMSEAQSKAADDDLKRRTAEQESIDAMNERAATLEAKRALTDQEMNAKGEKHVQEMEFGALAIELARLKIEGEKVKTAGTIATTDAKIEQTETQTDNAVRSTDASVQATADSAAIKANIMQSAE